MRKMITVAVLLASAMSVSAASAYQSNGSYHNYVFYDDVTKSNIVGTSTVYCDGSAYGTGNPTLWYDHVSYDC